MASRPGHLRLIAAPREERAKTSLPTRGDVALLAALLTVNLLPLAGFATGIGRWSAGTLAVAAACVLVCGRELAIEARLLLRSRRGGRSAWTR